MADPLIELEIVTPTGDSLSLRVDALTAPTVDGEFGVLPGHRAILAALATGIVSYRQGEDLHRLAVGAGFVEVHEDRAVLLTDRFVQRADVDPVQARLALRAADEDLAQYQHDPQSPEYADALGRELWAAVELELYGDPPPPRMRTLSELEIATREDLVSGGLPSDGAAQLTPADSAEHQ